MTRRHIRTATRTVVCIAATAAIFAAPQWVVATLLH